VQQGPTLPGVETGDDEDRIVVHVDLDCFYAACERLREPELEGEPVVVGMGYEAGEPDGAVATASYEAREYGVESAQAISSALDRLPRAASAVSAESDAEGREDDETGGVDQVGDPGEADDPGELGDPSEVDDSGEADEVDESGRADAVGHYRPVDMEYYEAVAGEVKAVLQDCADTVREVSIDEAYLDVTDRTDWSVVEGFARHVKQRIDREVGLTASVGVAPTMHAAKVASDHDKPDGLVVVEPGEVAKFLAPLDVEELHGIGPVTASTLRGQGIETAGDLADADREWIREEWGDRGVELQDRARGIDPRAVEPRGRPKSLSRESAFAAPEADHEAVRERIEALAGAVADRARSKAALYRTIGIKVVLPPFDVNTRERSLSGPVDDPELVESIALELAAEFADATPRKVGVRVSNLSFADADQSTLSGWDGEAEASGDGGDPGGDGGGDVASDDGGDPGGDGGGDLAGDDGGGDPGGNCSGDRGEDSVDERGGDGVGAAGDTPGQSVLDRVWSDGPAEHADPEPIGQPPDQTTLSEFE